MEQSGTVASHPSSSGVRKYIEEVAAKLSTPIHFALYEHLFMRIQFAVLVYQSFKSCSQLTQPFPVGLAKLFDLTFVCTYHENLESIVALASFVYALSPLIRSGLTRCWVLFLSTMILAFVHVLNNTFRHSQGKWCASSTQSSG